METTDTINPIEAITAEVEKALRADTPKIPFNETQKTFAL